MHIPTEQDLPEGDDAQQNSSDGLPAEDLLANYAAILQLSTLDFVTKERFVKKGISKDQLNRLKDIIGLDYLTLSNMLAITDRTLYLKKGDDTFSLIVSDRILAIAELYSFGYKVFGNRELFNEWMRDPNDSFYGRPPTDLMITQTGKDEVRDEIRRMKFGIF